MSSAGFLIAAHLFICSCILSIPLTRASGTQMFDLSTLCKGQFPTQMHRKIDGAVIVSRNDKNLECTVTFSAEYVSQRFLIRFDEFNMECGDRLYIYDSANAIGNHRAELTCRYLSPANIGSIRTRGHYVTLKFVADGWGTDAHRFTMVITAFKDPSQGCRDAFYCGQENMCISNRLLCDDVHNCEDKSDELRAANCTSNFILDLFASTDSTLRLVIINGLIVISFVIVILCICFCQRRRRAASRSPDINNHSKNQNEASGSNGAGTMITLTDKSGIHSLHPQSTLESIHKSGNLHLPAESQGYTTTQLRLRRCFMGN